MSAFQAKGTGVLIDRVLLAHLLQRPDVAQRGRRVGEHEDALILAFSGREGQ